MEFLRRTYSENPEEEDDSFENDGTPRETPKDRDYLGLCANESDEELDKNTEREYQCLKSSYSVLENATVLSSSSFGPVNACCLSLSNSNKRLRSNTSTRSDVQSPSSRTFRTKCPSPVEEDRYTLENAAHREIFSNEGTDNKLLDSESSNVSWENTLKCTIQKADKCCAPTHCVFRLKISHKSVSSTLWNNTYSHLLLATSLDGSAQVWDYKSRKILNSFPLHAKGIKAGVWSRDGQHIFSGGFDRCAFLTNLLTGKKIFSCKQDHAVSSVQVHPVDDHVFLTGSFNVISAWDSRQGVKPIRNFHSNCKQVLCMAFLPDQKEFVCSTEIVSRDSADRTIMAWDFDSGALMSNQIYHERHLCPWICVDASRNQFLAQSSGNYIAEFSASKPYKMNKYRRYEDHDITGYGIGCCLSADNDFLATGDASGTVYVYKVGSARVVRRLNGGTSPGIGLAWHPHLASILAVGTWDGELQFWA